MVNRRCEQVVNIYCEVYDELSELYPGRGSEQ